MRNLNRNQRIAALAFRPSPAWQASGRRRPAAARGMAAKHLNEAERNITPSALAAIAWVMLLLMTSAALGMMAFIFLRT